MSITKPIREQSTKEKVHSIIFEAETPSGKAFDILLLFLIIGSVAIVMLESVDRLNTKYHDVFVALEWVFTILFTIEYVLRIYCVYKPWKYITSSLGIIDLISIIPTYLMFFIPGSQSFMVVRLLRLLRVFRLFKLGSFTKSSRIITKALRESRDKIFVFLFFVFLMVIIIGSFMYFIEGDTVDSKFTSIPRSVYWAIVTLTTVGYGDITPTTEIGQFLAALVMIMGYAIIAVPTGIVSAEMVQANNTEELEESINTENCMHCGKEGHAPEAIYCNHCGENLNEEKKE